MQSGWSPHCYCATLEIIIAMNSYLQCVIIFIFLGFRADAAAFFIFVAVVLMVQQAALSFGELMKNFFQK